MQLIVSSQWFSPTLSPYFPNYRDKSYYFTLLVNGRIDIPFIRSILGDGAMYYLPNPVMAPIAYTLEIQLTQLYVLSAAFVGVALITPPVCVGAYTAAATAMVKPQEVIRHLFPYIFVVLIFCGLVYIFVLVIATWLPSFL